MKRDTAFAVSVSTCSKRFDVPAGVVVALDAITFAVARGTSLAIVGPSGCGKSTLLGLLGGLDVPTSGTVRVDGDEISSLDAEERAGIRRQRIGLLFQTDNLLPFLTAAENVAAQLALHGETDAAERCYDVLRDLRLGGLADRLPDQLSGGQRQRVGLARAVVHDPNLILADEPTGALDAANSAAVIDILLAKQAKLGATVVVVTHDRDVAARLDRRIEMLDGRIVHDSGRLDA